MSGEGVFSIFCVSIMLLSTDKRPVTASIQLPTSSFQGWQGARGAREPRALTRPPPRVPRCRLRRYPRKFPISLMEADVQAVLAGEPLPPPSARLEKAWEDAKREALKSEYAFKLGLNCAPHNGPHQRAPPLRTALRRTCVCHRRLQEGLARVMMPYVGSTRARKRHSPSVSCNGGAASCSR